MSKPVIAFANDHGALDLKAVLKAHVERRGYEVVDLGTTGSESVDYPDYADHMAQALREGRAQIGVLLCGTGIGISIAANRYRHVRAALVHDAYGARLSREHNNANVICFGGRTIGSEVAKDCLDIFLDTSFEGGRHEGRVNKMS